MKKAIIFISSSVVLIGGFLTYRYFIWGKGNKGMAYPTMFGYPRYDLKALAKDGYKVTKRNGKITGFEKIK